MEQEMKQVKTFQVEVGQDAGHLEVIMGVFWIDAEQAKDVYGIALCLAEDYGIEDPIIISIGCEDIVFDTP